MESYDIWSYDWPVVLRVLKCSHVVDCICTLLFKKCIEEGMCYGECREVCKPDDSQTVPLDTFNLIHFMLIKIITK